MVFGNQIPTWQMLHGIRSGSILGTCYSVEAMIDKSIVEREYYDHGVGRIVY